jgi:magnesium-transporting ATPase (P-type)
MSKEELVKKAGLYTIFFVASTLFFYFCLSTALYPYSEKLDNGTNGVAISQIIGEHLFLPLSFGFLCLMILGLFQFVLIRPSSPTEKRIFAIARLVYFGLSLGLSLLVFIMAIDPKASATLIGCIAPLTLCIAEIVLGILQLLSANKELAVEESSETKTPANPS